MAERDELERWPVEWESKIYECDVRIQTSLLGLWIEGLEIKIELASWYHNREKGKGMDFQRTCWQFHLCYYKFSLIRFNLKYPLKYSFVRFNFHTVHKTLDFRILRISKNKNFEVLMYFSLFYLLEKLNNVEM